MKRSLTLLPIASLFFASSLAYASSDDCEESDTSLHFSRPSPSDCSSDLPFLEPYNDSSTNLHLLLEQFVLPSKQPPKPSLVETSADTPNPAEKSEAGEAQVEVKGNDFDADAGTCISNTVAGSEEFKNQLSKSSVGAEDKSALILLRDALLKDCGKLGDFISWSQSQVPQIALLREKAETKDWVSYLQGAYQLYHSDPVAAANTFRGLSAVAEPWLKETSEYLLARATLVASQVHWDGYGDSDKGIDTKLVQEAEELFSKYLLDYPEGKYVESSKGLLRRAKRLSGDRIAYREFLIKDFERIILQGSAREVEAIHRELENHLFAWSSEIPFESPLLAAEIILLGNRTYDSASPSNSAEHSLQLLDVSKEKYDRYPGLYSFLKAELLFTSRRYDEVVKMLPADETRKTMLGLSQLTLLAESNERLGRFDEAATVWREVLSATKTAERRIRIALLRNRLRAKAFREIAEAPVGEYPDLKRVFLEVYQEKALQEVLSNEKAAVPTREMAASALLYHYLLNERFHEFLSLFDSQSKSTQSEFGVIHPVVQVLEKTPKDPRALLDLGHFQENFYDEPKHSNLNFLPSGMVDKISGEVTNRSSILPEFYGKAGFKGPSEKSLGLRPLDYYLRARASAAGKQSVDPDLRAEILYRLIWCFRWTSCYTLPPASGITKKQRASWFAELKKQYPESSWAEETKYYY